MKKRIFISIKPEWVEKILNGKKTVEVRKSFPQCSLPVDVYIYCTKGENLFKNRCGWFVSEEFSEVFVDGELTNPVNGKVVAKFTLKQSDKLDPGIVAEIIRDDWICKEACLSPERIKEYSDGKPLHLWRIDALEKIAIVLRGMENPWRTYNGQA